MFEKMNNWVEIEFYYKMLGERGNVWRTEYYLKTETVTIACFDLNLQEVQPYEVLSKKIAASSTS